MRQKRHEKVKPEDLARSARERAEQLALGPEREALMRKARQLETAAHINEWLGSPGLQPPK
jgi:alkylhydroperoxidase family enzyme